MSSTGGCTHRLACERIGGRLALAFALALTSGPAWVSAADDPAASAAESAATAAAPPFNGDLDLYSNYDARGLTYTRERVSIQGRLEYDFAQGPYGGFATADRSAIINKETVEIDPYMGYRMQLGNWTVDAGFFSWLYPHSRLDISNNTYDNVEATVDVTYKVFGVKVWYDLLNYWGLDSASALPDYNITPKGSSRGSSYFDSHLSLPLGHDVSLKLHAGHQFIRNYSELDYTDWLIGFEKIFGHGIAVGVDYTQTNANEALYVDGTGLKLGRGKWVGYIRVGFP